MLAFSAVLTGEPGSVTVHARDADGAQGASLLASDSLDLNLAAGPMTGLAFEESGRLHCGMRDCIGALKLLAVDSFGNTADCPPFEVASTHLHQDAQPGSCNSIMQYLAAQTCLASVVAVGACTVVQPLSIPTLCSTACRPILSASCQVALAPSALAADDSGTAASVAVAGGNKVKLKDGEALFKAVRIEAEAPGVYTLHAKSASRKVSCQHDVPNTRTAFGIPFTSAN